MQINAKVAKRNRFTSSDETIAYFGFPLNLFRICLDRLPEGKRYEKGLSLTHFRRKTNK